MKTESNRPLILVSNDDGIEAPGVRRLIDFLLPLADIVCVCPLHPHSGMSMALTVKDPLRVKRVEDYRGVPMFAVNGTPADCVKVAHHCILPRMPEMVVAGINHGSNAGINLVYSGTMGAAMEGCVMGVPSVGFSLTNHSMDADFTPCGPFIREICSRLLDCGLPDGVCLNVNIPDCDPAPTQMRVVRQCRSSWSDEYREYTDPAGHPFYMVTGSFINDEPEREDTDEWCMSHGIVSIVPVSLDRTTPLPWLPARAVEWTDAQLTVFSALHNKAL